jgi:hypothetical protein
VQEGQLLFVIEKVAAEKSDPNCGPGSIVV